jgi:hypothetical protein
MGSPPRWIPALGALVWAVWILHLGTDDRRTVVGLSGTASEAIQHIMAFAILGALAMAAARRRRWLVFGLTAMAGVLGEFAQLAASDRTFSFVDMAFSAAGAALGVAAVRRSGWYTTVALVTIAGLLIAIAPRALELSVVGPSVVGPVTSFPDDCSAPPPRAEGSPQAVLDADFGAEPGGGATHPVEIGEPTTAALRERLIATDEFSVAVEFSTTALEQEGPVRLFTISAGVQADQVNFHLGLENDDLSVRLRTSCDLFNPIDVPDVVSAGTDHRVVVTWGAGTLEVWVDAVMAQGASLPWGDLERWDPTYRIIVGDEVGGGRRFEGSVRSVTMWDRVLDESLIVADSANTSATTGG